MTLATDYLRETSLAMADRYSADCVTHACAIAELLLAERAAPWIGRLRHRTSDGDRVMHWPLIPTRFSGKSGPTWTTHYVACAGVLVYDPIVGVPIDTDCYASTVFGKHLDIETHLDSEATERLLLSGGIRATFRP